MLLAGYGAEVLKVEDTSAGDYLRWWPPYHPGVEPSAASAAFIALNRGKRSIRIDLKTAKGRDILLRLVRSHDVLLESFRPGALDGLGVGYERCRAENPRLVYCAITGYGQTGSYRRRAGHDLNYLGLSGVLSLTGESGGPPVQVGTHIADMGGGSLMAAFGIMAALRERDRTGTGGLVDVPMTTSTLSWLTIESSQRLAGYVVPTRGEGIANGGSVCYRPYQCADGWVTLAALERKFWAAWCEGVGREDLLEYQFDSPGSPAHAAVSAVFAQRTRADWEAFALVHDCCLEPVLDLEEALASELVAASGLVTEHDQPGAAGPIRLLDPPIRFGATAFPAFTAPAPLLGEHTTEVLHELGYEEREVAAMIGTGAAAEVDPNLSSTFLR